MVLLYSIVIVSSCCAQNLLLFLCEFYVEDNKSRIILLEWVFARFPPNELKCIMGLQISNENVPVVHKYNLVKLL